MVPSKGSKAWPGVRSTALCKGSAHCKTLLRKLFISVSLDAITKVDMKVLSVGGACAQIEVENAGRSSRGLQAVVVTVNGGFGAHAVGLVRCNGGVRLLLNGLAKVSVHPGGGRVAATQGQAEQT
jgi:hypothetical protein